MQNATERTAAAHIGPRCESTSGRRVAAFLDGGGVGGVGGGGISGGGEGGGFGGEGG